MTDPTPYARLVAPVEDPRHAIYRGVDVPVGWEWRVSDNANARWSTKDGTLGFGSLIEARPRPVPPVVVSIPGGVAASLPRRVSAPSYLMVPELAAMDQLLSLVRAALDKADHG